MTHPHEALVREAFRAYAAGDLDAFAVVFTDDVVWHIPGTNRFAGRFDGIAAVRRFREDGSRPGRLDAAPAGSIS